MNLFDILTAKKLGGGGGQSSSSFVPVDLSTLQEVIGNVGAGKKWYVRDGYSSMILKLSDYGNPKCIAVKAKPTELAYFAYLTSDTVGTDQTTVSTMCDGQSGRSGVVAGGTNIFIIPSDCVYIFITHLEQGHNCTPDGVYVAKDPFES